MSTLTEATLTKTSHSISVRAAEWASRHDWFLSYDGQTVFVREFLATDDVMCQEWLSEPRARAFTSLRDLAAWAGY